MMKKVLRICAGVLAGALLLSAVGCKPKDDGKTAKPQSGAEGRLFSEPVSFDVAVGSHASWPYNENWAIWKYFQEATGATFHVQAIPSADLETKLPLMMASPDTLPDLLYLYGKSQFDTYALTGALISLDGYNEQMPNYHAFLDSLTESERTELINQRTSGDGKVYSAPCWGTQTVQNIRTWLYRKDIFEKHNLQTPSTYEELYQVCKKLKELYPESYPLSMREGSWRLDDLAPGWKPYLSCYGYYDYDAGKWGYGAQEDELEQMIAFFSKMRREGLMPPDFMTMETKSWEELMSTDRGFITFDYVVRIDFFNVPNREQSPAYTLALMEPPKPDIATGSQRLAKSNLDFSGYCVLNTKDEKMIANSIKLVDWMYTGEAEQLLSWGKEGETYEVVDGKKKFILENGEQAQIRYGVGTMGTFQLIEQEAYETMYTEENVQAGRDTLPFLEPYSNPTLWLAFNEEEESRRAQLATELRSYTDEELSKFLLEQKPLSEWDSFRKGLEQMGVQELLSIYEQAYARVAGKL